MLHKAKDDPIEKISFDDWQRFSKIMVFNTVNLELHDFDIIKKVDIILQQNIDFDLV